MGLGLAEEGGPMWNPGGFTVEFQSQILPRYARRSRQVDEVLLGAYLTGVNTRRIRKALEPLLGEAHLSKSAVSRVVERLRRFFDAWDTRDPSQESYPILYLDALSLKIWLARRVISVPVLGDASLCTDRLW